MIRSNECRVGKVSKCQTKDTQTQKLCAFGVQSISNGGTRTLSKSKRWLLNCMDKDTDKYKDKDKSSLLAHHIAIGPIFGLVFSSSSTALESR